VDDDEPALVAAADVVEARNNVDEDVPELVAADVAVAVVVDAAVAEGVAAVVAGNPTAPDDPVARVLPAMVAAVVAVCAAAGLASAIRSGSAIRRRWAITK
jgi:hypothetical protein